MFNIRTLETLSWSRPPTLQVIGYLEFTYGTSKLLWKSTLSLQAIDELSLALGLGLNIVHMLSRLWW